MAVVKSPKHVKLKNRKARTLALINRHKLFTLRSPRNPKFCKKKSLYNSANWRFLTFKRRHRSLKSAIVVDF